MVFQAKSVFSLLFENIQFSESQNLITAKKFQKLAYSTLPCLIVGGHIKHGDGVVLQGKYIKKGGS